jgi:hypothetical protein
MSKKTVAFKMPQVKSVTPEAEAWVKERAAPAEQETPKGEVVQMNSAPAQAVMKRFTIDVEDTLHKRIKAQCAMRGVKMADVIREMLEREFPAG